MVSSRRIWPRCWISALCVAWAACSVAPAAAQVNVEPLRRKVGEAGVSGEASGSLTAFQGNTAGMLMGGNLLVGARSSPHWAYTTATGDFSRFDHEVQVAKGFAHARYNYEFFPWVAGELFGQVEADRFRRINLRELLGVGPRWTLVQSVLFEAYWGTAYMLEHTQRSDAVTASDRSKTAHRFSNYVTLRYSPIETIALSSTLYVQPRFDDVEDVNLLSVSFVRFEITDLLHSRLDATVRYESRVPPNIETTDIEIKNSIGAAF